MTVGSAFMNKVQHEITFVILIFFLTSCSRNCTSLPMQCDLTPESGPCEAAIEKYFFDAEDQVCKPFIWGGCEGGGIESSLATSSSGLNL